MRWSYASTAASLVMQVVYTATMSRLLSPADFGAVALGSLLLRFVTYFGQLGLGSAVVQRPVLTDSHRRTAFTLSVLVGGGVALIVIVLAPLLSVPFGGGSLSGVLRGLAIAFLITASGSTAIGSLRRAMRFQALAVVEVSSFAFGYLGVGIGFAIAGASVWSLVAANIAQAVALTGMAFALSPHGLRPDLDRERVRDLVSFGGLVSLVGFTEFLTLSADTLVVGAARGPTDLGFYSRANLLVGLPAENFSTSATKVLLPGFSSIQSDRDRVRRAYVAGVAVFAATVPPLCAAIAVAADTLVPVLLGPGWGQVIPVIPFVAVAAGLGMMTHFAGVICEALALLRQKLRIQLAQLVAVAMLLGVVWQNDAALKWYAAAWAGGETLRHLLYVRMVQREIRPPGRSVALAYGQGALLTVLPAAAMVTVGTLVSGSATSLMIQAAVGLSVWAGLLVAVPGLLARRELADRGLLRRRWQRSL